MTMLAGKVVLVTGAGRGLGLAMADGLAAAGARVAMLGTDETVLLQAVEDIQFKHGRGCALPLPADVTDEASAAAAVDKARRDLGTIDVLINNAAIGPQASSDDYVGNPTDFWELDGADWLRVLTVNAFGPQLMAQLVVPAMLEKGWGRIINVTTSLDTMYAIDGGAYGPSKAALEASTVIMARHLSGSGVTANALLPGGLSDTRIVPPSIRAKGSPLISPEVMQAPAVWLASDESGGINGMRFIAARWDPALPVADRIRRAGAPAGWPQIGPQTIDPAGTLRTGPASTTETPT